VIDDDQPFITLENKYFRKMIKILNSDALVPSADTIKNDILESFKMEQKKMSKLFQVILNICMKCFLKNYFLFY
jgi:hypothetical protein